MALQDELHVQNRFGHGLTEQMASSVVTRLQRSRWRLGSHLKELSSSGYGTSSRAQAAK